MLVVLEGGMKFRERRGALELDTLVQDCVGRPFFVVGRVSAQHRVPEM